MSGSVQMDNVYLPEHEGGVLQWLLGKNVTSIILYNNGADDGYVGIGAPFPARILPVCKSSLFLLNHIILQLGQFIARQCWQLVAFLHKYPIISMYVYSVGNSFSFYSFLA